MTGVQTCALPISGVNGGVVSVCVLTGEATVEDILQGEVKPSLTFKDVREMLNVLKMLNSIGSI